MIKDKLITDEQIRAAQVECVIHAHMTHPNIIKLYKYSENEEEISLIMEYANQATYLQDLILDHHTPVEDEQALQIFAYDILNGISYIHSQGAIHCDIKLENMLAHKEEDDKYPIIKICDFGLAHNICPKLNNKALKKNTVGTWGYIAPEVKNQDHIGPEIDMWAFGLILYEMAVAYKPTQVKNYKYTDGELPFNKRDWRGKPDELKSLIQGCMEMDPEKRLTAEESLKHEYFTVSL